MHMAQPNEPTVLGQLTVTGTGEVRDKDGNLLDGEGKLVEAQDETGEI